MTPSQEAKARQQIADDKAAKAARDAEDATLTDEEKTKRYEAAVVARDALSTDAVPKSEMHTYPDGSAVVGVPPFPKLSPKQRAEADLERVGAPADPADTGAPS